MFWQRLADDTEPDLHRQLGLDNLVAASPRHRFERDLSSTPNFVFDLNLTSLFQGVKGACLGVPSHTEAAQQGCG